MSCGVGLRLGSDLAWLWLWRRQAAVAPNATDAALKRQKTKKKKQIIKSRYIIILFLKKKKHLQRRTEAVRKHIYFHIIHANSIQYYVSY